MNRVIALIAVIALTVAACGSDEEAAGSESGEIYAASLRELVTVDNTFGGGGSPFSELLVQKDLDPAAGTAVPDSTAETRPLTEAERNAIEAALSPIASVRWIDDAAEWRTDDLMPVVEGSAILGVGPITMDDDGALVPVSMWCGGLCGTWFTYRVIQSDGGWAVSGIEGPIAVS
jgi:hypothetical protein